MPASRRQSKGHGGGRFVPARRMVDSGPWPSRRASGFGERDYLVLAVAQSQDRKAFAELFEYFAPRVKSYLIRLGASDIAEELAQEVMLSVWRKSRLFDPAKASVSTWIFTIARNVHIDRRRKERRPEFDPSDPVAIADDAPLADHAISSRQNEQAIRAALSELPAEQARVIEMSFFEDKPHSTIAAELKLPLGTVKSRLRLAFARLRGRLESVK
jgi:RNA polymerase sigma-70 factor (ECF subfamily)